eukprot:7674943-Pyramimonas_sp.AAC.1
MSPFPLTAIVRAVSTNSVLRKVAEASLTCTESGLAVLSIRDAVLTVSPTRTKRGRALPRMPVTRSPVCSPTRKDIAWRRSRPNGPRTKFRTISANTAMLQHAASGDTSSP